MHQEAEETAILLIYDFDLSWTMIHSEGAQYQRSFERPYAANLRMYSNLREHIQRQLRSCHPRIVLGCATYGEFLPRISESCLALGLDEQSVLIYAKFIARNIAKDQGKNEHIAQILLEHYQRSPHIKITHVVLCDDDKTNIKCLRKYANYIQSHELWSTDPRLLVPVRGLRIPRPEILMAQEMFGPNASYPKPVKRFDENLQVNCFCETPASEQRFLECLQKIDLIIAEIFKKQYDDQDADKPKQLNRSQTQHKKNPLARSLDSTENLQQVKEAAKLLAQLMRTDYLSPVKQSPPLVGRQRLFKSGPY